MDKYWCIKNKKLTNPFSFGSKSVGFLCTAMIMVLRKMSVCLFRLEAGCLKSCQSQALGLYRESNGSIMLWSVCGLGHVHHSDIFTAASDEWVSVRLHLRAEGVSLAAVSFHYFPYCDWDIIYNMTGEFFGHIIFLVLQWYDLYYGRKLCFFKFD